MTNDFEPPSSGAYYCSSLVEWSYEQALARGRRQKQKLKQKLKAQAHWRTATPIASGGGGVLCPGNFTLLFVPLPYWQAYYATLGLDLPVNVTGSNPTLLLHSPRLTFASCDDRCTTDD